MKHRFPKQRFSMRRGRFTYLLMLYLSLSLLILLVLPAALVSFWPTGAESRATSASPEILPLAAEEKEPLVRVYLTREERVLQLPLEQYVRGVLAAEMPAGFHPEALKAQAIASRTYIVQRMIHGDFSDAPPGAMVTDTVQHQVFWTEQEMRRRWGAAFVENINRLTRAVEETRGQVITYQGKPIYATYFSTSNGYTENAQDYWQTSGFPYLKSVPSPWDQKSPHFRSTHTFGTAELLERLGLDPAIPAAAGNSNWIAIVSRTGSQRVSQLRIGDQTLSGRQVREALDLPSTSFEVKVEGQTVTFEVQGYGHGVGMSQYGAHGMAQEGNRAEEIIRHYYQGVELSDYRSWLK